MSPTNRNLLIGVVAAVLLLCCCCLIAGVALVVADPFGWGLLNFLPGRGETITGAVPADSPAFATMDLTALTSPKLARILQAYADVPGVSDYSGSEKINEQFDQNLQKELGLSFTDDILPWVGRYAGFSVASIPQSPGETSDLGLVLMVEARNQKEAEAFVTKLTNALAEKSGSTPTESEFKGVTLHTAPQPSGGPVVLALSKGIVFMGQSESAVQSALEAQSGALLSAAKSAEFKNLLRQLPKDSLLTVVAGGPALQAALEQAQRSQSSLPPNFDAAQSGLKGVQGMGFALSAVEAGLRFDTLVALDEQQLSDAQREWYAATTGDQTASLFPDTTLVYVASQRLDLGWAVVRESMNSTDFKDAMQSFENQFGFNPDEALLPYLQGAAGVAVMADAESALAKSGSGNFGFAALVGTKDANALGDTLTAFNNSLEKQGLTIDSRTVGGQSAYVLNSGPQSLAVYGVAQDYLAVASSEPVFAGLFSKGANLAEADRYKAVWRAFPGGMRHALYADVTGLVDLARQAMPDSSMASFDEEVLPYLKPVTTVAMGSAPLKNGVAQTTLIVFIEGGK